MTTIDKADFLFPEDRELLAKVKNVIRRFLPTATVLLYGSVARGTKGRESDYDILVLTDEPLTSAEEDALDDAVYDVQLERGVVISTLCYSKAQWELPLFRGMPFRHEVEKDAIVL